MDDFTRECVAIEVDRSLPGLRVTRVLDRLHTMIGLPQTIVVDNGPAFAGRTLDAWAYAHGVTLRFIRPGKRVPAFASGRTQTEQFDSSQFTQIFYSILGG